MLVNVMVFMELNENIKRSLISRLKAIKIDLAVLYLCLSKKIIKKNTETRMKLKVENGKRDMLWI